MSGIAHAMGGGGGSLAVSASNVSAIDGDLILCGHPGATTTPNAQVLGGSGNYSYKWARTGAAADFGPWQCSDNTALNPRWTPPDAVCDIIGNSIEVWKLTVTDNASGQIGYTSINVSISWVNQR